jgi:hypothetical protein
LKYLIVIKQKLKAFDERKNSLKKTKKQTFEQYICNPISETFCEFKSQQPQNR